jgi:hypothetical protein
MYQDQEGSGDEPTVENKYGFSSTRKKAIRIYRHGRNREEYKDSD